MSTKRDRLEALRAEQGNIEGIPAKRRKLEELRLAQGDGDGSGQGDTPSNNPVFEMARKSGFLKGYLDQASGIAQIAEKFKTPDVERKKRELEGFGNVKAFNMDEFIEREERLYQENRKSRGDDGFDWARLAGNIANPVSVATAKGVPLKGTAGFWKKAAASGIVGGVSGLAQPVLSTEGDYKSQKALQASLGVGVGAVAQPVISAIKGVGDFTKYIARPFTKTGQMKDVSELYIKLAGDSKNKIIKALNNYTTQISGNKPTAGQAIAEGTLKMKNAADLSVDEMIDGVKSGRFIDEGLPDNFGSAIVKLEKELARKGTTGDELKTVFAKQMARRSNALKNMIDSGDVALTNAINRRSSITAPLYAQVEKSTKKVNTTKVVEKVNELMAKNVNEDAITIPMRKILGSLKDGDVFDTNPQNMYSLSKQIKRMIETKTPSGTNEFNVSALSDVKKLLDKQIGKAEPAFSKAQKLFKEHSKPVNQIQVSREFGKALEDSLKEEGVRARPFINAMDNAVKTLKKSTGFARFKKLEDVMNPKQMEVLKKVRNELVREERTKTMASGTQGVVRELSEGIEITLPNMLSRPMMLANAILRQISKDKGPAYEQLAIKIQKNPELLVKILKESGKSKERDMFMELFERYTAMIPSQEISRNEQLVIE